MLCGGCGIVLRGEKNMNRIVMLGSGTPTPTAERFGTSYVVEIGKECIMFDCGPSTTHKLVKAGLVPTQISHLFFTHHHFDHNADIPCFFLCRWDQSAGRYPDLEVYGPKPTKLIMERLFGKKGAFYFDLYARVNYSASQKVYVNRGGKLPRLLPSLKVKDLKGNEVVKGNGWKVTAVNNVHAQPFLEGFTYRLDSKAGSVLITGDTQICKNVVDLARGVDVIVCMCWNFQELMDADGEAPGQCGTAMAAKLAKEAGAKKLVLTHTGPFLCRPGNVKKALKQVKKIFKGNVVFAKELLEIRF